MLSFLTNNPGVLMVGNCCLVPLICFGLGVAAARLRPRLRSPLTFRPDDGADDGPNLLEKF